MTKDLRKLAYQLAGKNRLPSILKGDYKSAGLDRLKEFFERHPEPSLRKSKPTSAALGKWNLTKLQQHHSLT
jgi:hypothetical protein